MSEEFGRAKLSSLVGKTITKVEFDARYHFTVYSGDDVLFTCSYEDLFDKDGMRFEDDIE